MIKVMDLTCIPGPHKVITQLLHIDDVWEVHARNENQFNLHIEQPVVKEPCDRKIEVSSIHHLAGSWQRTVEREIHRLEDLTDWLRTLWSYRGASLEMSCPVHAGELFVTLKSPQKSFIESNGADSALALLPQRLGCAPEDCEF